ncbi:sarcosine oxidase subunit delta [Aureimonas ureilytica]|uniref:Sarcosine oxidase subunit delta n=1 Tax=Aureimonas ureilytica TaxID=401562 RepID=A0A175RRG5_9HYPH|nr:MULTISPECIES: sarcosine oxidase subunit delta [Aureimonas]KTQ97708.1 sarcosine oxidase subunit delta [Aureimonas ureilytica]KTR05409.1 sarcosine oxidase subunit delta [Aureimonas ureilytica]
MLLITCPYCGPRPELEFRYAGEAHVMRAETPSDVGADDWGAFLYTRSNPRGLHAERWRHIHGCARFFNAVRDTRTDFFVTTYKIGEPRPDGVEEHRPALSGDNVGTWSGEVAR